MEMKSILKNNKKVMEMLRVENSSTTQSSSIGAVRWNLPEHFQAHSSAPTRPTATGLNKPSQPAPHSGLRDLRSLQECVQFINHWKEQVDRVCKGGVDPDEGTSQRSAAGSGRRAERSLEESRQLILEWADELHHVDQLLKEMPWAEGREDHHPEGGGGEEAQTKVMEWAKELQTATESCGVQSDELGKVLRRLGLKKSRLGNLLPLLEFITWSLLKEDSMTKIPQIWLLAKQKTWIAGVPRYIPNSVWNWILSAEADVVLDPNTNHPWLQLSDDQRSVQEASLGADLPYNTQRFDTWPCVLGWGGYLSGRHYWEVDIANNGYWRVGLTTADSKRHGRFPMSPKQGYWVLWRSPNQFYACTKPETALPSRLVPRSLGVYLDYEEGQISFYNAETKTHIYTFTGSFKKKLYPLFAPLDGRTLMRIRPPRRAR
ncbi:nuclear factor 7, brain [Antennarius striatus]|uniref:nuclear factor 7, brain n=1 Tax=Antennarius striatus TaxID=241820 RepID=UPI0035B30940